MNTNKFLPSTVIILVLCATALIRAQDTRTDDIEHTRAFLVKLKNGSTITRAAVDDDWVLTPIVSEAQTRGEVTAVGNWWYLAPRNRPGYVRSNSSSDLDWDGAYDLYLRKGGSATRGGNTRTPLGRRGIEPASIEFIEPDLGFFAPVPLISPATASLITASGPGRAQVGSSPTRHWPQFSSITAYQDDEHSQLKSARETAATHDDAPRIRIAFLDTGYDPKHVACPPNINKELSRNFVEDKDNPDGISLETKPGLRGSQSHGTGTISILAGGSVDLADSGGQTLYSGWLGGAPSAEVIPMRVATSVVHFETPLQVDLPFVKTRPSGTTRAILYAVRNNCDIISMSHGGLPSKALADAVNIAYEAGVAMFFASGDYLQPPNLPLHTPRYVVYPAAFSRTMCVCGVTATSKTYGIPPQDYDPNLGSVDSWRLRGNWGPPIWMKNAIATFSPNIPWAHLPDPKRHESQENVIDLDGQGTSASTPQAAAAAALWLQHHRQHQRLKSQWRTWRKAESVYAALRSSAKKTPDNEYSQKFFGNGILQAKAALEIEPPELREQDKQKAARVGLGWLRLFTSVVRTTRADGASEEVLKQMLGLELAQIAHRSVRIQEIMQRYDDFVPDENETASATEWANFRKELFDAIKTEPRASRHLKEAVMAELDSR